MLIRWFKWHFRFHYIGVVHLPIAVNENGRMTASKPVMLFMTESGRRRATVTNRNKMTYSWALLFDYYYAKQIDPWLVGGEFPIGIYNQDVLAKMLVKIIDNKLDGREDFNG